MLNPQQNKKLLQKLSHCLEVFEPYLFEPQGKLDYRMFETREHLRAVPPDQMLPRAGPPLGRSVADLLVQRPVSALRTARRAGALSDAPRGRL